MYYYQVEKLQEKGTIYQFGKHHLTRLQLDNIVETYNRRVQELEKFNAINSADLLGYEEIYAWEDLRYTFAKGDNLNNLKWNSEELLELRIHIEHKNSLQTPITVPNFFRRQDHVSSSSRTVSAPIELLMYMMTIVERVGHCYLPNSPNVSAHWHLL